ncbi:hypothetical protein [Streptomyces sp. NPDC049813]|uniref:hypothetical protein n=1 Tax=Streptomyces sp. NPDC049813 TaxID=3365597 RepID=UPI00378D359E
MTGAAGSWARREWGPLYGVVRARLRTRGRPPVPLTLTAVGLTAAFQYVQNQPWGYPLVQQIGAVRAADPLWLGLARTPLSLYVPALDLPVWGALAQVLLVLGVAELSLGRRRTLLLAYAATLAGTLYARVGVALGPAGPLGLPASDAHVVDTGPSAAVVGLALYVCWRHRARWTGALVAVAMAAECALEPNLAGKEHLAAVAATLALCGATALRGRAPAPAAAPG